MIEVSNLNLFYQIQISQENSRTISIPEDAKPNTKMMKRVLKIKQELCCQHQTVMLTKGMTVGIGLKASMLDK